MKRLWLFYFPLLFMPNVGLSKQTNFGVLEMSDWLIVPFIVLLIAVPSPRYEQLISKLNPLLWTFAFWALLSVLSIHFRYSYLDDIPIMIKSYLKLARLGLYVVAGILIARKVSQPSIRRAWLWSLLAALFVLSFGLLTSGGNASSQPNEAIEGYKSYNAITVSIAILCSYVAALWIDNVATRRWNQCACIGVVSAVCCVLFSANRTGGHGRGGWVAFIIGFVFLLWKRTDNLKILAILVIVALASFGAYESLSSFRSLVDITLAPADGSASDSVDDGGRVSTWKNEAPKLLDSPMLGSGFFHRGGQSGLWSSGSHNFYLQMFLETGLVGGINVVLILAMCWRLAGHPSCASNRVTLATRVAILSAIVGGMSGEYYYGGTGVLLVFATFALAGSLPACSLAYVKSQALSPATMVERPVAS